MKWLLIMCLVLGGCRCAGVRIVGTVGVEKDWYTCGMLDPDLRSHAELRFVEKER